MGKRPITIQNASFLAFVIVIFATVRTGLRTPDFHARIYCNDYSPRNRPQGMSYSLNGRSDDIDLPHDEDGTIHDI
jgi:hypothetical protein